MPVLSVMERCLTHQAGGNHFLLCRALISSDIPSPDRSDWTSEVGPTGMEVVEVVLDQLIISSTPSTTWWYRWWW